MATKKTQPTAKTSNEIAKASKSITKRKAVQTGGTSEQAAKLTSMTIAELNLLPKKLTWRDKTNDDHVAELAHVLSKGGDLPPVTIAKWGKTGEAFVDGHHRLAARNQEAGKQGGDTQVFVEVYQVKNEAEALALAFRLNASHGLNLTPSERRAAIIKMLQTPSVAKLSNVKLGVMFGCSDMSIKRYRDAINQTNEHAKHDGHKNQPEKKERDTRGKSSATSSGGSSSTPKSTEPREPSPTEAKTPNGLPIEVRCASRLCGGGDALAGAILKRLFTENDGSAVIETSSAFDDGIAVAKEAIAHLQSFIDDYEQACREEDEAEQAVDDGIAAAKKKAAEKAAAKKKAAAAKK